jgi:hypothetical protein
MSIFHIPYVVVSDSPVQARLEEARHQHGLVAPLLERGTLLSVVAIDRPNRKAFAFTRENLRVSVPLDDVIPARFGVLQSPSQPVGATVVLLRKRGLNLQSVVLQWPAVPPSAGHMAVPFDTIAPIASPFDAQAAPLVARFNNPFKDMRLPIMSTLAPLRRVAHGDWLVAWSPTLVERGHSLKLELLQTITYPQHQFAKPVLATVVLHTVDPVDLSVPFTSFAMPPTALPDVSIRNGAKFTVQTMIVASRKNAQGNTDVYQRMVSRVRSVGGFDATMADRLPPPASVLFRPAPLSPFSRANVSLRVGNGVLRPLAPAELQFDFESSAAELNDKVTFNAIKVELRQVESVTSPTFSTSSGIGTLLFSHTLPGFTADYSRNDFRNGAFVRLATATVSISVPFLDGPPSFQTWVPANVTIGITHVLTTKLYTGAFAVKTELSTAVVLAPPLFDRANAAPELPALPIDLQRWANEYVDMLAAADAAALVADADAEAGVGDERWRDAKDERRDKKKREKRDKDAQWRDADDDNHAAPAPPVMRDVEDEQEPENLVRVDSVLSDGVEADLKKLRRFKCNECSFKLTDGKLRRAHHGCSQLAKHQEALNQYQRLERLVTNVTVSVLDVESDRTYKIEMAPQASRNGLFWRIEEATGRRVRALTVLGSPVPPDAKMSELAELELELELDAPDASIACAHCGTSNEAGILFCKNADDCGRLLPARLVQTPYEPDMNLSECVICFEAFEPGARLTFLPCMHGFHSACAIDWLSRKTECPTCSSEITKENLSVF